MKQKDYSKIYYSVNKEEIRKKQAEYQAAHKDEIKALQRAYYQAHREEILAKAKDSKRKKARRDTQRRWASKNPDYHKEWLSRGDNKAKVAEYHKAYYEAHKDEIALRKKLRAKKGKK